MQAATTDLAGVERKLRKKKEREKEKSVLIGMAMKKRSCRRRREEGNTTRSGKQVEDVVV